MQRRILVLVAAFVTTLSAAEPPVIPVGLDAYRMWEKWPYQRIGARAYMRSTYDRRGGNEGADASHFLYQVADDFNVTLDVAGPGVLYFVRCNHWHGSPWHYEVDDLDYIVKETSTGDPNNPVPDSVFMPENLFPNPLTWTWSITKGADLNWVPMAFERSFRLAYSRTRYGTGYYIYHLYDRSAKLSQKIRPWDGRRAPEKDVLELISRAGTDLTRSTGGLKEEAGTVEVNGTNFVTMCKVSPGRASMLRTLELSVPKEQAIDFGKGRLRIRWDGREPSIDTPVSLFFGAGTLYSRDGREFLVKGFPMVIRYTSNRVHLACYFPMPFFDSAQVELSGNGMAKMSDVQWRVRHQEFKDPKSDVGYFHATYRDHPNPEPGQDMVLLDTQGVEGGSDWSGSFVGTSWIFSHRGVLNTLEGDPRFFFDDSQTPQAFGTGTEEWGGGGDYWGGRNMTLPFAGKATGAVNAKEAKNEEDLIESAYRFLLADLMPFGSRAIIRLEHGGQNESTEHYETVTYWYGMNQATLVKTDELKIGDAESEKRHKYESPQASELYTITSRYELGVDTLNGKEVYPAHSDTGRKTKGESSFELELRPDNFGVVLRRKLDYELPNQRGEVFVANADGKPAWKLAGTWYLAGGNTCIYSNPREELGATQHNIQTSNRRFRDDEFIIPRELTKGHSKIRVRIKFVPVERPLFPGHLVPELGWSEIRYDAYCWVMPTKR